MLNAVIRFALANRPSILGVAIAVMVVGSVVVSELPIDVLPDLTRPRVVLITEAPGLAPEEVETLVTFPLETALNGATGVQAVRSTSDIGLSLVYVEFDWGADVYTARQIVQERIGHVVADLPEGVRTQMGPISSLLGQIMLVGMWSEDGTTGPLELRTQADWVVKQRLLTIPGIAQVITMGGGQKQFQVLVDLHALHEYEVTLHDVEQALRKGNLNVTGGYLDDGPNELLVRGLGRAETIEDVERIVVAHRDPRSVEVQHVARVIEGPRIKRGDAAVNGTPSVVFVVAKQPGADTRRLTEEVREALREVGSSLPEDVVLEPTYEQREFIDYSVTNVVEALRDGSILVVIVLFLFLLNVRTTLITLTAIPLSIVTTALVFRWFGMSINVMTLGGLAVALGELVDDAIVDVENIFRRLRENRALEKPRPTLTVVYEASSEVRGAILISTVLVILVFAPLFALTGMEGRLFTPLGVAYIVSIIASTVVSLTVTPVLSSFLLGRGEKKEPRDGPILWALKQLATPFVWASTTIVGLLSFGLLTVLAVSLSLVAVVLVGKDFLPSFDEGAAQVNVYLPPGTSLETTNELSEIVDEKLAPLFRSESNPAGPIVFATRRTGRAEEDEHAMPVNVSEYVLSLNPDSGLDREGVIRAIHEALEDVKGVEAEVEQPIAHLMSHMLSGVTAQIAIKLYGDDLAVLRTKAREIEAAIADVEGIAPPVVEQQTLIPQLRVELQRDRLAEYGLSAEYVNETVETALNGRVVGRILEGQRTFDLLLRLDDEFREDHANLHRVPIELPHGGRIPLSAVANVVKGAGPNLISREDARRRIVVRVNTLGRDLVGAVEEIRERIERDVDLPESYFVVYGGQFEARESATNRILLLSALAIVGVAMVLYTVFPSVSLVLQILVSLPAAFVGGVAAIVLTGQSMSVASMVGFISLGGIAARNGILLVGHYLQLHREEGFTREMILRGSLERLAPVLMTALTTGLALVPLVLGGHLPGKEILYPVATVILGGLVTSTLAEFLLRPGLFWFLGRGAAERLAPVGSAEGD